ncbi:CHRD domain-containing protein [Novosphingobium mangrovi (ex Huang et al. 2023)]|uniref:CHRD domain-containing protein n=1 Tax=Novosphingobium mangrovi (ex Huang et al. 2023) TaxID=2976432 RepID=A0ABT2I8K2_9SPHN|nr:CHRD domain-containing protein [Novosphingobium mangrovi (ex Huang et al. 2023)]MCT2401160.1 CHRD domain-containing protein [Novosphingobium mangrovi (ex Huang et al. 2023)]
MRRFTSRLAAVVVLAGSWALPVSGAHAGEAARTYHATLTGAQEVKPGDPDGSASADVTVSADRGTLCYDVHDIQGLDPVVGAHIHRGAVGEDGPPTIPLTASPEGGFKGCVAAPDWLDEGMKSDFTGYYINLHTHEFPAGAIRGQLGL